MDHDEVRAAVRQQYAKTATIPGTGCGPGCCAPKPDHSLELGYTADDLAAVPEGADLGLGCGNPQAIAGLRGGETVLDLGSGAGFDCFLAARQVGAQGRVIGVDMTGAMIERARANAAKLGYRNVEFRLGEIESLPVEDDSVDVVISNCVVNLAADKPAVFAEIARVLRPGGRIGITDIVADDALTPAERAERGSYAGCIAGALSVSEFTQGLTDAGAVRVYSSDVG